MAKFKKRRKIKVPVLQITIIMIIICIFKVISYINLVATPILMNYAELETNRIASILISRSISKELTNEFDVDNLMKITKDSSGNIQSIDFNTLIVNKVLAGTNNLVQMNLKTVEDGSIADIDYHDDIFGNTDQKKLRKGIIYEIPIGVITKNSMLSNIGPKIPVRLQLIGSVNSSVKTRITNYGINSALIEVFVEVEVSEQVNLPFTSKMSKIKTEIPVIMKIMQGKVPEFYGNSREISSPIYSLDSQEFTN